MAFIELGVIEGRLGSGFGVRYLQDIQAERAGSGGMDKAGAHKDVSLLGWRE